MNILIQVVLLVLGFVMLIKGADWFVEGASKIADRFGIPQLVIGLTIVAMGTSAPEAAVSISAALKGGEAMAITIGNVVGSNILNVLIILGLTAIVIPLTVQKTTMRYELPFVIFVSVLMALLGMLDGEISRLDGGLLWVFMIVYLAYLFIIAKKGQPTEEEVKSEKKDKMIKLIAFVLIGGVLIVWGSDVTVNAATALAKLFGMSERLIGLTIVALGTSLPELITSVTAGLKGKADIAIGNIVGSNIFNILFVIGTTALIQPVVYSAAFTVDTYICIGSTILLLLCVLIQKKLSRIGGAIMLACYAGYFVYLIR